MLLDALPFSTQGIWSEEREIETESIFSEEAMDVKTDMSMPILADGFSFHINIILYILPALVSLPGDQGLDHSFCITTKKHGCREWV